MYLGISGLQNTLSFFVKLIGFRGDRTRGINYLMDCMSQQKGARSCYSGLLLALYTIQIDKDMKTSAKYLQICKKNFPNFVLQQWVASIYYWKNASLLKAEHTLQKAIWTCGAILGEKAAYLQYQLGWIQFINLKWRRSLEKFNSLLVNILNVDMYSTMSQTQPFIPATPIVSNIPSELISKTLNQISQHHKGAAFRNGFLIKFITDRKKRHKDPSIQYMPHKACIPFQIGAGYAALGQSINAYTWLNFGLSLIDRDKQVSCSKQDIKLGKLCSLYFHRISLDLLPFQMLYFMSQFIKMPRVSLQCVVENITQILKMNYVDITKQFSLDEGFIRSSKLLEVLSGGLMVVSLYHLLQFASLSIIFADRLLKYARELPKGCAHVYLLQHLLLWQAKNYHVQRGYKESQALLNQAKKIKPSRLYAGKQIDSLMREVKRSIQRS